MPDPRLPTSLWLDAHLRRLDAQGVSYYIVHKGAYASGTILLKLNGLNGQCRLLTQERDIDGVLGWADALAKDIVEEKAADDYIRRAIARDPDLWAVEIEGKRMENPFIEK